MLVWIIPYFVALKLTICFDIEIEKASLSQINIYGWMERSLEGDFS